MSPFKNNCYKSYYALRVYPLSYGRAMVSTCCHHTFRPENNIILKSGIKAAWNSRQFIFQRKLIAKQDRSFCLGATCNEASINREKQFSEKIPCVKDAILHKQTYLDYMPKVLLLHTSLACNNNCFFCYQHKNRQKGKNYELSDVLRQEIKNDFVKHAEMIGFSGGEPLLSEFNWDLIKEINKTYPQKSILIMTNGSLCLERGLDDFLPDNVILRISLYGMREKTYEKITRSKNYQKAFSSVNKLILNKKNNLQLLYLVCEENVDELEDFCHLIEAHDNVCGIVINNIFGNQALIRKIKAYEKKYVLNAKRLSFSFQKENNILRVCRASYDPVYKLRYLLDYFKHRPI